MTTSRRLALPSLVVAGLATALLTAGAGSAMPNPYGPGSRSATVTVDGAGGYQLTETWQQTLVSRFRLQQGGVVSDGVRLPDDVAAVLARGRTDPLPPVLVPDAATGRVTADGAVTDLAPQITGHAVGLGVDRGEVDPGEHTTVLEIHRGGAGVTVGATVRTYVQLTTQADLTVTADGGTVTGVRCLTFPGAAAPCGRRAGDRWLVTASQQTGTTDRGQLAVVVEVTTAESAPALQPRIDWD